MSVIELTINDRAVRGEVAPRTHLGDFLRDSNNLTGTHLGCEHGVCGACTVLIDGAPVRACITFAVACDHQKVRTIEGFDDDELMKRLRKSFSIHHGLQCGFCTPGMLITARDIIQRFPDADEARIRLELSGNLCRCTGYMGIVSAIKAVLTDLKENPVVDAPADAVRVATAQKPQNVGAEIFQTFAAAPVAPSPVSERSPHSTTAPSLAPVAQSTGERKGWTAIDDSFVVPFPLEEVWAFMGDLPSVTGCLPGAELIEYNAERVKGKIAIKFGPMSANFGGEARLERDDAAHHAVMRGAGQDNISRSKANGDVTYALSEEAGGKHTRVAVTLEYMLQGPLAQFSRSGLVKDFVRRMIADFGARITAQLGGGEVPESAALSTKFNVGSMVWSVVWGRVKGFFGRKEGDSSAGNAAVANAASSPVPVLQKSVMSAPKEHREAATVADASGPTKAAATTAVPSIVATGDRKGWTAIEDSFVVPFPLEKVWGFMGDLPSVTACLPGAELIEHDAEKVKGKIAIKFGPMSANFAGAARLERDDGVHRAVMRGAGQDNISRSKANGDVTYALSDEAGGTQTRVAVTLEYMLQGPLAQFSRSGLIKDFVRRMIADFGARITAELGGMTVSDAEGSSAKFNVGSLVWSVVWGRIKRLFGRGE